MHCLAQYLFQVSATSNQHKLPLKKSKQIIGIDRGLRFIAVADDGHKKPLFFNGKPIIKKRRQFLYNRTRLQSKGTKSAKHRLKIISGRENRWMTDVNHQISKALVRYPTYYDYKALYLNLIDVRTISQQLIDEANRQQEQEIHEQDQRVANQTCVSRQRPED